MQVGMRFQVMLGWTLTLWGLGVAVTFLPKPSSKDRKFSPTKCGLGLKEQ